MNEDERWVPVGTPSSSASQFDRQIAARTSCGARPHGRRCGVVRRVGDGRRGSPRRRPPAPCASASRPTSRISTPAFFPTEADEVVTGCIHEGLVTFKPGTFDVVNCLAETFEQSKDGKRFDFKLKEGVTFHGATARSPPKT